MAVARKCDQPDCMAFVHPGCMVPCLGETFKPLWTKKWFCDEHLPSRRGSAAAAAAATATVKQPAKVAAAATAKTKTFADLQTGIEIAAVEDCAKTMRILGENLIVLGEQTVAAQEHAEKDYKKTVAAQKQAEKDYEKTAKQLATALAQLQEAADPEEAAKVKMNGLFDELALAMGSVCCTFSLSPKLLTTVLQMFRSNSKSRGWR